MKAPRRSKNGGLAAGVSIPKTCPKTGAGAIIPPARTGTGTGVLSGLLENYSRVSLFKYLMETRERIRSAFGEHLREHGRPPETVFAFCKQLEIPERDFFREFASFDAVESDYWEHLVSSVVGAVEGGSEWKEFNARQRLLSFLYAFCEASLDYRSLMLSRLGPLGPLAKPNFLKGFERSFRVFAKRVLEHGMSGGEIAERGRLAGLYPDALYTHFRSVVDFNLKDDSSNYERTDAFIEKTVAVAFDLIRTQVVDSALDLAQFLIPCRDRNPA